MKSTVYKSRLNQLESILRDSYFLLNNENLPIHNFKMEPFPDEIPFVFKPISKDHFHSQDKTILSPEGEIVAVDQYLTRNFSCKRCIDRERGIRSFIQRGRKKLLILHYSGNSGLKSAAFAKRSNKIIFRTQEIESLFGELINDSIQENYEEFFYQEYPGCHFNQNSTAEQWQKRSIECDSQILETITKEGIKAILVLGSSAVLRWEPEFCKTNQGKVMNWSFPNQLKIPFLITRSPEALSFAKNKSDSDYLKIFSEMKDHVQKLIKFAGDI
jgi:hypothetical protein